MLKTSPSRLVCLLKSFFLFLLTVDIYSESGVDSASPDVDRHLEMGKKLLAAGQLAEALTHYHAAIDGDPDNYMTYYRRATVFLALGKSKSALPDLDKVIELKPDFVAARSQRGNVLLKQGNLAEAQEDFTQVVLKEPSNEEVQQQLQLIGPLQEDIRNAKQLFKYNDCQGVIDLLSPAIEACPWDPELREIRAECYEAQGEYFKAITDLRPTTKLRNDNTAAFYKISLLHYDMGEADESLMQIRECLKLDQDHKECHNHYKKVKKLVKQLESAQQLKNDHQYEDCVSKAEQILKTEPKVLPYTLRAELLKCHCYSRAGQIMDGFKSCNKVLDLEPDNLDALIDRAETYIANEQYEEAIRDYQEAQNIDGESRRVREGLDKANKLLKQSQKRDYYKILGVKRTAKKKEILKAYKKLARDWHPDKYKGDDKKKAEKKFIDIAAAKEVLTDPEKRKKFDLGEDPLDPEAQSGGGHNPFAHGFNPFGSSGFNFKFHFN